jgi:hypothetical protein
MLVSDHSNLGFTNTASGGCLAPPQHNTAGHLSTGHASRLTRHVPTVAAKLNIHTHTAKIHARIHSFRDHATRRGIQTTPRGPLGCISSLAGGRVASFFTCCDAELPAAKFT